MNFKLAAVFIGYNMIIHFKTLVPCTVGKISERYKTVWALPHWLSKTQWFSYDDEGCLGNLFTSCSVKTVELIYISSYADVSGANYYYYLVNECVVGGGGVRSEAAKAESDRLPRVGNILLNNWLLLQRLFLNIILTWMPLIGAWISKSH